MLLFCPLLGRGGACLKRPNTPLTVAGFNFFCLFCMSSFIPCSNFHENAAIVMEVPEGMKQLELLSLHAESVVSALVRLALLVQHLSVQKGMHIGSAGCGVWPAHCCTVHPCLLHFCPLHFPVARVMFLPSAGSGLACSLRACLQLQLVSLHSSQLHLHTPQALDWDAACARCEQIEVAAHLVLLGVGREPMRRLVQSVGLNDLQVGRNDFVGEKAIVKLSLLLATHEG